MSFTPGNNPFDRTVLNLREKPISSDINQAQAQLDNAMRTVASKLFAKRTAPTSGGGEAFAAGTGFQADGFRVTPASPASMVLTVTAGIGFQDVPADVPSAISGIVGLDDLCSYKPLVLVSPVTFTVPAAPGANSRIDIIEVRANRQVGNPTSRLVLNSSGAFAPATVNKALSFALDGSTGFVADPANSTQAISYKTGTVAASPAVPATTPGYVKIAEVVVGTSVVTITGSALVDRRPLLYPGGVTLASIRYQLLWNAGAPTVAIRRIAGPPGMVVTVDTKNHGGGFVKGQSLVHFFGGELTVGDGWANAIDNSSTGFMITTAQDFAQPIATWSAGAEAAKAFHTPVPSVGLNTKFYGLNISTAVANIVPAGVLDDIEVYAHAHLGY